MSAPSVIRVFTYKEGLLSRLAHDLRLTLGCFDLDLNEGNLRGRFELDSLRVDGAVVAGRVVDAMLSSGDRARIEANMREDVLGTVHHPRAQLGAKLQEGAHGQVRLSGTLELAGRGAPLVGELALGERITGRFELHPSRWGIKPFRAFGGALKLQDRVVVEVDLATDVEGFDAGRPLGMRARWSRP